MFEILFKVNQICYSCSSERNNFFGSQKIVLKRDLFYKNIFFLFFYYLIFLHRGYHKIFLARERKNVSSNIQLFFSKIVPNLICVIFSVTMWEEGWGVRDKGQGMREEGYRWWSERGRARRQR